MSVSDLPASIKQAIAETQGDGGAIDFMNVLRCASKGEPPAKTGFSMSVEEAYSVRRFLECESDGDVRGVLARLLELHRVEVQW